MCIVELHVTVNNVNILNAAQECVYGELMSPATVTRTSVFVQNPPMFFFCPILTKFEVPLRVSMEVPPNIKFHGNLSSGSSANSCEQTDERNEANRPIFDYANEPNKAIFSCRFMSHSDSIKIRNIIYCSLNCQYQHMHNFNVTG